MIVTEISNDSGATWKTLASYDTFDVFYADALKFKDGPETDMLRVFVPGGFDLSTAQRDKITALGITIV